jgi:metal-responsive CopG/Arc/MetJ family transcriptional regulator
MRSTITVSLPEEVSRELDRVSESEGVSRSHIVRESVRDYLFIRQFRSLRRRMISKAALRGVHTDEDVFDRVS